MIRGREDSGTARKEAQSKACGYPGGYIYCVISKMDFRQERPPAAEKESQLKLLLPGWGT